MRECILVIKETESKRLTLVSSQRRTKHLSGNEELEFLNYSSQNSKLFLTILGGNQSFLLVVFVCNSQNGTLQVKPNGMLSKNGVRVS